MAAERVEARNFFPSLCRTVTPTPSGSNVVSYSHDRGDNGPILLLIHGYPQSAFEWRHLIPTLTPLTSLFVPELPGYGISSPLPNGHSKRQVGTALLEALCDVFHISSSSSSPRKIILGGHDRGARIAHRLAVDFSHPQDLLSSELLKEKLQLSGLVMLDIVPTAVQWRKFGEDPDIATGYFHWPLLANVEVAVKLIQAYGGAQWVRDAHSRLTGPSALAKERVYSDNAVEVYAELFGKEETLRGSCEDYKAGAKLEVEEQEGDQKEGRKIGVPTLVMFSKAMLGRRIDVAEEWKDWVGEGVELEAVGVEDGAGHYLPEEACELVGGKIVEFVAKKVRH